MTKVTPIAFGRSGVILLLGSALLLASGCKKTMEPASQQAGSVEEIQMKSSESGHRFGHYSQVNLVANTTGYNAAHIDPTLVNGWGLVFTPTGIAWVSSQGGHVSDVYDSAGVALSISPVHIPNPALPEGGNPTGVVFNAVATEFLLPTGGAARFIFVGVDGVLSAWNGAQGNHAFRKFAVPQSAFTGLTLANNNGNNLLYAANFRQGMINVWDKNWNPVLMTFHDPNIPTGYSPFNIQNIGGWLYVTYAKVGADGRSEAGVGKGFVDIYKPDGSLVSRFASRGSLNAPWGVTMAPASFIKEDDEEGDHDGDDHHGHMNQTPRAVILVGNFGDGKINAFRSDKKFLGQLKGAHHETLVIDGLWALVFPPTTSPIDPNKLYFAAGPDNETHGLYGYVMPVKDDDDED